MAEPAREQYSGCLIGQCLGDALGFIVEGASPEICRDYVAQELAGLPQDHRGRRNYGFGQYTDDSQLARELLQSYVARSGFDPADYARRIAAIFAEKRIVGRGRITASAAARLAEGVPWHAAGTPAPAAGNGSAMRAGPVGLFFYDDPAALVRAAHDQGRITHQDPRCSAGAAAIAGAVALALCGGPVDPPVFIDQLATWTAPLEPSFAGTLRQLKEWVLLTPEQAAPHISRAGYAPGYSDGWEGISPFVTSSVIWGLYSFLRSPGDYWQTVCTAIAVGGDVDTTAAMAGAISGAYLGLSALPAELAQRVTDRGTWGFAELVELAEQSHMTRMNAGGKAW
jgi:ADP-ribosylglycohydrolase